MAPIKQSGLRYKKRSSSTLSSFRDESSLVALPYEQTVQAEPPIPIPPRNPGRHSPACSTVSSSCVSLQQLQQQSQQQQQQQSQQQQQHPTLLSIKTNLQPPSHNAEGRPLSAFSQTTIVVAPPLPFVHGAIAPPTEQHPALRDSSVRAGVLEESWKRDSGVARTPSTATTIIFEEDEEDYKDYKDAADRCDWRWRRKLASRDTGSSTRPSYDQGSIAEVPEVLELGTRVGAAACVADAVAAGIEEEEEKARQGTEPGAVVADAAAIGARRTVRPPSMQLQPPDGGSSMTQAGPIAQNHDDNSNNGKNDDAQRQSRPRLSCHTPSSTRTSFSLADILPIPCTPPPDSPARRLVRSFNIFAGASPFWKMTKTSTSTGTGGDDALGDCSLADGATVGAAAAPRADDDGGADDGDHHGDGTATGVAGISGAGGAGIAESGPSSGPSPGRSPGQSPGPSSDGSVPAASESSPPVSEGSRPVAFSDETSDETPGSHPLTAPAADPMPITTTVDEASTSTSGTTAASTTTNTAASTTTNTTAAATGSTNATSTTTTTTTTTTSSSSFSSSSILDDDHHYNLNLSNIQPGPASPTPSTRTSRTWRSATTAFSSLSQPPSHFQPLPPAHPPLFPFARPRAGSAATAPVVAPRTPRTPRSPTRFFARSRSNNSPPKTAPALVVHQFSPITIPIPRENLLDDDFITSLSFSQRGSLLLSGKRAIRIAPMMMDHHPEVQSVSQSVSYLRSPSPTQSHSDSHPQQQLLQPAAHLDEAGAGAAITTTAPSSSSSSSSGPNNAADAVHRRGSAGRLDSATLQDSASMSSQRDTTSSAHPMPHILLMPADTERESQKVRSLYEYGDVTTPESCRPLSFADRLETTPEDPREDSDNAHAVSSAPSPASPGRQPRRSRQSSDAVARGRSRTGRDGSAPAWGTPRSGSSLSFESPSRRGHELAGGMEDWEDVHGGDVDRYGFISQRRAESRCGSPTNGPSGPAQHGSTRRRNVLMKRDFSGRAPSRKLSARSLNTQHSGVSTMSRRSTRSALRQASNLLPHNRDRRWMDEAGDMLTMSPMGDIRDDSEDTKMSEALKKKEWERAEKWRRMAKVIRHGQEGQGMEFEFDVKSPKLIERTWKGIPDRWRASAWFSFMRASARERPDSPNEDQIIDEFHRLQQKSSPDDVQIDLDVPRTINRHIMFRRRYRGGQRLLFRVLHAISIYFPETGYVQGMASLAATLLCYFDEENCFVMMVRMWQFRGLEVIYRPGFEQLISVLKEFEGKWMGDKDVAKKLTELSIDATAYGARWYLTLFNLSIPFAAQLRVWDVFLLLGGTSPSAEAAMPPSPAVAGLDVLHATSAALMHALRDVLMDSDFENTMKALTSWIPIKDEDLLMKVVRAEWKLHHGKKKA